MSCNYCNKGSLKTSEIKFFLIEASVFFPANSKSDVYSVSRTRNLP